MLSAPEPVPHHASFLQFFFPSLTAMVGYWATLSLNIPDFTRYAKSQESQIVGQAIRPARRDDALHLSSASRAPRPRPSSSAIPSGTPSSCWAAFISRFVAFLALISMLVATLNVNIGANVVWSVERFLQPRAALHQLPHRRPDHRLPRPAMMPWKLMATLGNYIFGWLVGYSACWGRWPASWLRTTSSCAGRGSIPIRSTGAAASTSTAMASIRVAIVALVCGVVWRWSAASCRASHFLYDYAWFVGFFVSGVIYYVLMLRLRSRLERPLHQERKAVA